MRPVIMLFAKAPVPGQVKTRLQPLLTLHQAAELHASLVADVLAWLEGFLEIADVEIHTDQPTDAWEQFIYPQIQQSEGDLGQRMLAAAERALARGHRMALILGADAPNLPKAHLETILASPADVCIGPCEDGGYYAIGMRRTHPAMFDGVQWSTELAYAQTHIACITAGLSVADAPVWYDIDLPVDLVRLMGQRNPPRTDAWLKKHGFISSNWNP